MVVGDLVDQGQARTGRRYAVSAAVDLDFVHVPAHRADVEVAGVDAKVEAEPDGIARPGDAGEIDARYSPTAAARVRIRPGEGLLLCERVGVVLDAKLIDRFEQYIGVGARLEGRSGYQHESAPVDTDFQVAAIPAKFDVEPVVEGDARSVRIGRNGDRRAGKCQHAGLVIGATIPNIQVGDEGGRSGPAVGEAADRGPVGGVKGCRLGYVIGVDGPCAEARFPVGQRDALNRQGGGAVCRGIRCP